MGWFSKKPKLPANAPKWLIDHFEKNKQKAQSFVVFDFETTGLNPQKDQILSFAFLRVSQNAIQFTQSFEGYLNSNQNIKSAEIHQVGKQDLLKGFDEMAFLEKALDFIGNDILVAHHVDFDLACLNHLLAKRFSTEIQNKTLDTAKLAARIENPLMGQYGSQKALKNLDSLCQEYNIVAEARHSASGDTLTTAMLLLKLINQAERRKIKLI